MTILNHWFLMAGSAALLCLVQGAEAQVTVTGGTVTASASAGVNSAGFTFQSSTPAPVNVASSGQTTLTASAAGTAPNPTPPPIVNVTSSATGTVTVQSTAGGTALTLYSSSIGNPAHIGPGVWGDESASANDTVFLTLSQSETVNVNWTAPGPMGPANDASATIETLSGSNLFSGNGLVPQNENLFLAAGQYEFITTSATSTLGGQFPDGTGNLAVTFPAPTPVPLPGAAWLLGSGLMLLGARMKRGQPQE